MRVGLVCPYSLSIPGGVQNQVMGLARALHRRGHSARVLAPCDGPPPASFVTPLGSSFLNPSNGSVAPIAPDPSAQFRTMRALWDERFDVVHVHEPFVPGPTLTATLLKQSPLVGTFHAAGTQPAYANMAPIAKWVGSRLDSRVAVSQDALALAEPHTGGDWTVLFNGVDTRAFAEVTPAAGDGPTVLFLGRHEPRKGLEVLLKALPDLISNTKVWIAGDGESTADLKAQYNSSQVTWLGRISDSERDARMAGATVFCAPSLGGESFGIILLEAMAAGTPVVASSITGYEKVATGPAPDGSTPEIACAELVAPDDPVALAGALNRVLTSPSRQEELIRAGLARSAQFDLDTLCGRYLQIYSEAVSVHADS